MGGSSRGESCGSRYRRRCPARADRQCAASREFFEHKQADLIAGIEEVARLRVVGGADDVAPEVLAQDDGILALHAGGMAWPTHGKVLMAVEAAQLDDRAVEREALRRKARLAEAIRRVS